MKEEEESSDSGFKKTVDKTRKLRGKRKLTHSSTVELAYANKRQQDEEDFENAINESMEKVIEAMKLS